MIRLLRKFSVSPSAANIVLAALSIFAIFLIIVVWRLGSHVSAIRLETAQTQSELSRSESLRAEYLSLKSVIDRLKDQQNDVAALIPSRRQFLQNIQALEKTALTTGNTQSISIFESPPSAKRKKEALPVTGLPSKFDGASYTIALTGGMVDLIKYLKTLEHQPFLAYVRTINIEADRSAGSEFNSGLLNTKIDGVFFFTKE